MNYSKYDKLALMLIFSLSCWMFVHYLGLNSKKVIGDEAFYIQLSNSLRSSGVLNFHDPTRTYFYPMLIALTSLLTWGSDPKSQLAFAFCQYAIFCYVAIDVAFFCFRRTGKKATFYPVVVFGILNPYLIDATTLILTDILSASLITLAFVRVASADLRRLTPCLVIFFCLSSSVMLRPSAGVFAFFIVIFILFRLLSKKNVSFSKLAAASLLGVLVVVPQICSNVSNYSHFTPLIHRNLYHEQSQWAVQNLKYGTVVIPGEQITLHYHSPFEHDQSTDMATLAKSKPLEFALLFTAHMFAVFDWGFVSTYIRDLHASARFLPSLFLYTAWFLILYGIASAFASGHKCVVTVFCLPAAAYILLMGTVCAESRFGFPIYLILLPFIGFAFHKVEHFKKGCWPALGTSLALVVFLAIMFGLSYLLDTQTHRIIW